MSAPASRTLFTLTAYAAILFALPRSGNAQTPEIEGITWGIWDPEMDRTKLVPRQMPIDSIVIHQTETSNEMSETDALNSAHHHGRTKGWGGIAYHYLIGPSGTVYIGRDVAFQAASNTRHVSVRDLLQDLPRLRGTAPLFQSGQGWAIDTEEKSATKGKYVLSFVEGGLNSYKASNSPTLIDDINVPVAPGRIDGIITVSFIGDFNPKQGLDAKPATPLPYPVPTDAAKESCVRLCAWLIRAYDGLTVSSIYGHRERASSTCPGQGIYFWLRGSQPPFRPTKEGPAILAIKELVPSSKH